MLNPLLVIRLLPALSHNGSVIWEPCSPPAMLCPHWWMHWSEPLFSLLLQRGSDELFSSCISNGPYIMNSGRGVAMEGWILFLLKCLSCLVCLCCHDDQSIIQDEPEPSVPSLIVSASVSPPLFFSLSLPCSQWQRHEKIQRWRPQSWCSITCGPRTQTAQWHKRSWGYWTGTALWEGHQSADAEREKPGKERYMQVCSPNLYVLHSWVKCLFRPGTRDRLSSVSVLTWKFWQWPFCGILVVWWVGWEFYMLRFPGGRHRIPLECVHYLLFSITCSCVSKPFFLRCQMRFG